MKTLAIILTVLVLLVSGVLGYALFNTALVVEGQGLQVISAADMPEEFNALRQAVGSNTVSGALFRNREIVNAGDYNFYVYTLRLKNNCLVPACMTEVQLSPLQMDVLCYDEDGRVGDIHISVILPLAS